MKSNTASFFWDTRYTQHIVIRLWQYKLGGLF